MLIVKELVDGRRGGNMVQKTITLDRLEELAYQWWKKLGGKTKEGWDKYKELWIKGYMSSHDIEESEVIDG